MNDDIEEILDEKKVIIDQHWNYIIIGNEKYYDLPKRLLDYITNLQQENEELKKNKLKPDELANLLNQELIKQRDDYKSRAEKAVEELKLWQPKIESLKLEKEYLLDILNGKE